MTYGYEDATAVIGPLSPAAEPGAFDLCAAHVKSVTVPHGWQMVRLQTEFAPAPPSTNDLMGWAAALGAASGRAPRAPAPARRVVPRPAATAAPPGGRPRLSLVPSPEEGADAPDPWIEEQESDDEEDKE